MVGRRLGEADASPVKLARVGSRGMRERPPRGSQSHKAGKMEQFRGKDQVVEDKGVHLRKAKTGGAVGGGGGFLVG